MKLYDVICKYVKSSIDYQKETSYSELPYDFRRSLFEHVKFFDFSYEQLEIACKNPLIPQELLTEALMTKLAKYECPQKLENLSSK